MHINLRKEKFAGETDKLVTDAFIQNVEDHLVLDYCNVPPHNDHRLSQSTISNAEIKRDPPRLAALLRSAMLPGSVAQTWLAQYLRETPPPAVQFTPKRWGDPATPVNHAIGHYHSEADMPLPPSWLDDLLGALRNRFTPPNNKAAITAKIATLKQGTGSFRRYLDEFEKLQQQLPELQTEDQRKFELWKGAKEQIRNTLTGILNWTDEITYTDFKQRLLNVDEQQHQQRIQNKNNNSNNNNNYGKSRNNNRNSNNHNNNNNKTNNKTPTNDQNQFCDHCRKNGHSRKDCWSLHRKWSHGVKRNSSGDNNNQNNSKRQRTNNNNNNNNNNNTNNNKNHHRSNNNTNKTNKTNDKTTNSIEYAPRLDHSADTETESESSEDEFFEDTNGSINNINEISNIIEPTEDSNLPIVEEMEHAMEGIQLGDEQGDIYKDAVESTTEISKSL